MRREQATAKTMATAKTTAKAKADSSAALRNDKQKTRNGNGKKDISNREARR